MIVRIPASSANLGPGFDSYGIAWQLYNEIEFEKNSSLVIEGCDEAYKNPRNLAYAAFSAVLQEAGIEEAGAAIRFLRTDIPVSRGMGSSAALICGGVLAANELYGLGFSRERLFQIAARIEGHPDNIAPALFGGFTASATEDGRAILAQFPVSEAWHFCVLIPDFELSTALARRALPEQYSRADAVFNVSRGALLLRALADGDGALLRTAMQDKLHQPYREKLIDGFEAARKTAYACGADALCISGAGSTLLCTGRDAALCDRLREALKAVLPAWRVLAVEPDFAGAVIL